MDRLGNKSKEAESVLATYLHKKAKMKEIPLSGVFELTSRCNFNCKMCYVHSAKCNLKKDEKSAEWWINLGKQAVKEGMLFLLLTGGEPLLREDFPYIYTELNKLGLLISINTNGYLLRGEIVELFQKMPPTRLNITLYGSNDDVYEELTGVRGFTTVMENIERIRSYGVDVRLNCSITKENASDMENLFHLIQKMDVHVKATSYMFPPLKANVVSGDGRLSAEDAAACRVAWSRLRYDDEELMERIRNMQNGLSMFEEECLEESEPGKIRCRAGTTSFWLDRDGKMSLCGMIGNGFDVDTYGFKGAWEQVKKFTKEIQLPAKCEHCKHRPFCHVCAAVCYTETGSYSSVPEYVCRYCEETARLTKIELERLEKKHESC